MLAQHYKKSFLKLDKKNKDLESVLNKIIEKEDEFDEFCTKWTNEQVESFLKDFHSISPNTISRALSLLREFTKYIAKEEQSEAPEYKLDFGKLYDLIDYDKLLNNVMTFEQYRHIKNQLDENVRDKVIFELAWSLLSPDEIKNLKEKDVVFEESEDTGMDIALLKISNTKMVRIEDPEIVEDLRKCKSERSYYVSSKDGRSKRMKLKDTDYLIKPVSVGKTKILKPGEVLDETISNPSITLQNALEQQGVTCPDFDINEITIESIRRSKLIFLLAPQNEKYFDTDLIQAMLDSGNIESNLFWLKKVANIKYAQKN